MARKSVKEILEAARKGGPVSSGVGQSPAPRTEPPEEPAEPVRTSAPQPVRPAAPPKAGQGRPLSLKEKLAAARAGASAATSSAPAAAPVAEEPPAPAEPPVVASIPTPAQLGRPLTLQEKMAAARAKAAPAGAGAVSAKTAAAKTAAPKSATKRTLPPLSEMSDPKDLAEALRQAGAKREAEAAALAKAKEPAAKPAREKERKPESVLPRPSKADALASAAAPTGTEVRRRHLLLFSVLTLLWVAWGFFFAGLVAFTAMLGRFMFPNVLAEPPSTIKVGVPQNYDPEAVNERFKAEWGFWIVRSQRYNGEDILYALQSVCTHLGCPPNWLEGEQKFKCPCHGSGFYISGVNFEGPAPRPLERFKVTLADDGQIIVDKSQKFQQELGQWTDPDSFIAVV